MTLLHITQTGKAVNLDGSSAALRDSLFSRMFRGFTNGHPCIGAKKTAAKSGQYFALYDDMSSVATAFELLTDLDDYFNVSDHLHPEEKTCALSFMEPVDSQQHFAELFWKFLQVVHDIDCQTHGWAPNVSDDPASSDFEMSFRGRAIFTTTLNPCSPRTARRFINPTWVMNQLSQFDHLRDTGQFTKWQKLIRETDAKHFDRSGLPNPILVDHGYGSAADQLAGSKLEKLVFKANRTPQEKEEAKIRVLEQAAAEQAPNDLVRAVELLGSELG